MKSRPGRGNVVRDVVYRDILMDKAITPIVFAIEYPYFVANSDSADVSDSGAQHTQAQRQLRDPDEQLTRDDAGANDDGTPHFRNLFVSNLRATGAATAGKLLGLRDAVLENIQLSGVHIQAALGGWNVTLARGKATDVTPPIVLPPV